jgi:hypothetical protein
MQGDSIFALILGVIIVIGLIILIIIELTKPKILGTIRQNPYQPMYIPTYHPKYQPNYQPNYHQKIPVTPVKPVKPVKPPQIVGDRSTPFCKHTLKGCYPGTQTPIR